MSSCCKEKRGRTVVRGKCYLCIFSVTASRWQTNNRAVLMIECLNWNFYYTKWHRGQGSIDFLHHQRWCSNKTQWACLKRPWCYSFDPELHHEVPHETLLFTEQTGQSILSVHSLHNWLPPLHFTTVSLERCVNNLHMNVLINLFLLRSLTLQ